MSGNNILKTKSTYYTEQQVKTARKNVETYEWARKLKDDAVSRAEGYLKLGIDKLRNLVTSQSIPRSMDVCNLGCPVCGTKIFKNYGNFSWETDCSKSPWKVTCPHCKSIFPSNDFSAYYKSGLDDKGFFNPDIADRSLLKNELYPEKTSDYCVDDGYGWVDQNGRRWTFIAYYNHVGLWGGVHHDRFGVIIESLNAFKDAYIYTGDLRYANAGLVMLDRIADVYPNMDLSVYKDSDGYFNSHGHTGQGKISGSISETFMVKPFLFSYDAFFPALSLLQDLHSQTNKNSNVEIQENIETGIVKEIYSAVKNAQIRGNTGMHQSTLALAALVIDNYEISKKWMDWVFKPGGMENSNGKKILTGGNISVSMINDVNRDGLGDESSPSYNYLWLKEFTTLALITQNFKDNPQWNLFLHPKLKKMYHTFLQFIFSGKYSPQIGDAGAAGKPELAVSLKDVLLGYKVYRTYILAQAAYFLNGNSIEGIHDDIFADSPDNLAKDIQKVIDEKGTFKPESCLLPSYGFAGLKEGKSDTERSVWMYFGRNIGHGHKDTLNLGLFALGIDMAPDLGNPEYKKPDWAKRYEWTQNTISHNTVTVDRSKQKWSLQANPHMFESQGPIKIIDVEAPNAYPQTVTYRRTVAMIDIDKTNSYILDIFRVKGGNDHVLSFHGPEGKVSSKGLTLKNQLNGTYAGEKIPFAFAYDKPEGSKKEYQGSGFHYLYNVDRDNNPPSQFNVLWDIKDTWKVHEPDFKMHLSYTMLTQLDDVALASGDPAKNKPGNPESLRYILAHRKGENLESQFVSVLEPFKEKSSIKDISPVHIACKEGLTDQNKVAAVKITLTDGCVHYICNSLNKNITYVLDDKYLFRGYYGVVKEKKGTPYYAYLGDGTLLNSLNQEMIKNVQDSITGYVTDFTKELVENNKIVIKSDEMLDQRIIGKYLYVKTGDKQTAYCINSLEQSDIKTYTLDIGDVTLIEGWIDAKDINKGYAYSIKEGDLIKIPLSHVWR